MEYTFNSHCLLNLLIPVDIQNIQYGIFSSTHIWVLFLSRNYYQQPFSSLWCVFGRLTLGRHTIQLTDLNPYNNEICGIKVSKINVWWYWCTATYILRPLLCTFLCLLLYNQFLKLEDILISCRCVRHLSEKYVTISKPS